MIARGHFTNHLVTELGSFSLPVGDNDNPSAPHGWNTAGTTFTPWLVLAPGTATKSEGSFRDPQQDWRLNYFLTTAGVSREQTESVSDRARDFLKDLSKQTVALRGENWKLTYVHVLSIGNVQRIGATNPPYHLQTDTYEFWLSKEH